MIQLHQDGLDNVVTRKVVVNQSVYVDTAVILSDNQMETFKKNWPGGYYHNISKTVSSIAITRKHIRGAISDIFNTDTIYARAIGLHSGPHCIDTDRTMVHEQIHEAKSKANLNNSIKVEI